MNTMRRKLRAGRVAARIGLLLGLGTGVAFADEVAIQSFARNGALVFNEISDATAYRVEWASAAGESWTTFTGAASALDCIPAAGSGVVTASVPMLYRVVAATNEPPFSDMAFIPAGSFVMGALTNLFGEGESGGSDTSQHLVQVSAFYMDRTEVTKSLWDEVYATATGYEFSNPGAGKQILHPVHTVNWYDAAKWCNARSEMDSLTPVYYADEALTEICKSGEAAPYADWTADGYRLPTEAEWEKAARGGAADTRFPWDDYTNRISHAKANYVGDSAQHDYDLSDGAHPRFAAGADPATSPSGSFAPNGYGLYDMAGNVMEWCWDRQGSYPTNGLPQTDPRGPNVGDLRILRDGSWGYYAHGCRCSRRAGSTPEYESSHYGFRCVRKE